jgi:hypothetical protein
MLRTARHLEFVHAGVAQRLVQRIAELADQLLTFDSFLGNFFGERLVFVRLEVLERQILELPPHLRHAEAVRERRVQVACLRGDTLAFVDRERIERAHVVQPVRELDDDDARVLRDREQQLAVALDLAFLLRTAGREFGDLCESVDYAGDLLAEIALDVGHRDAGVFDDIVDQPAGDGHRIELQLRQDLGDFDAVRDEGLAGETLLTAVRLGAETVRAREKIAVETLDLERVIPPGDPFLECRCRHSRPASAKLVYRPRPMIT